MRLRPGADGIREIDARNQSRNPNGLVDETLEPAADGGNQDDDAQRQVQTHRRPPHATFLARCLYLKIRWPLRCLGEKSFTVSVESAAGELHLETQPGT